MSPLPTQLANIILTRHTGLQNKAHSKPPEGKKDDHDSSPNAEGQVPVGLDITHRNEHMSAIHTAIDATSPISLAEVDYVCILDLDSMATKMRMHRLETIARRCYMMGSPRTDLLLHLVQFNFTRALMDNARILGLTSDKLHDDALSSFNTCGPWQFDFERSLPHSLQPTATQRSIEHHPWLDLLPVPQIRETLIRAGDFVDEEQLCLDMKGSGSAHSGNTGIIVWKDPWNPAGWEVTEPFARSWGWVLRGCRDLAHSTNQWRMSRNERPLFRMR